MAQRHLPIEERAVPREMTVVLKGEVQPEWHIVTPIAVHIEQCEDGSYLATDDVSVIYGQGDTSKAAHLDYIDSLIRYYRALEAQAAKGDEATRTHLQQLQTILLHKN